LAQDRPLRRPDRLGATGARVVEPAADHTAEIEDNSATRVRVRFRGPAESRIEIRYEGGQVTQRID